MNRTSYGKQAYHALCLRRLAATPLRHVAVDVTRRYRINWFVVVLCMATLVWFIGKVAYDKACTTAANVEVGKP